MKIDLKKIFDRFYLQSILREALALGESPVRIARSVALGIFIGMVFPIGLQTAISVPVALLLNCNLIFMLSGTLISNPVTVIPLYMLAVHIGRYVTGIAISIDSIGFVIQNPQLNNILELGFSGLLVLLTGTAIQGLVYGVAAYLLVYFIMRSFFRNKK